MQDRRPSFGATLERYLSEDWFALSWLLLQIPFILLITYMQDFTPEKRPILVPPKQAEPAPESPDAPERAFEAPYPLRVVAMPSPVVPKPVQQPPSPKPESPHQMVQAPPPPDVNPKGSEKMTGQVVTVAKPPVEEVPESGVAGQFARKVKQQLLGQRPSASQNPPPLSDGALMALAPSRKAGTPKGKGQAKGPGGGRIGNPQASGGPRKPRMVGVQAKDGASFGDGAQPLTGDGSGGGGQQDTAQGNGGMGAFGEGMMDLGFEGQDPSTKYRAGKTAFATDDYLPGLRHEGDSDVLNSLPYKYAGFFERLKGRVRPNWNPNGVYAMNDPTGQRYPHKDRTTVLSVILDQEGKVLEARVIQSCGLTFLDNEAVRAMRAGAPFTNPPEGLVDADGRVRFTFGFSLLNSASNELFWRL